MLQIGKRDLLTRTVAESKLCQRVQKEVKKKNKDMHKKKEKFPKFRRYLERKLAVGRKPQNLGLKAVYLELFGIFFAFSGLDSDQARCGFWSLAALGKTQGKNKKQEKKKEKKRNLYKIYKYIT